MITQGFLILDIGEEEEGKKRIKKNRKIKKSLVD